MAATPVLIDGFQFLRPGGTGIASYVRTLSSLLRSSGCAVNVLYGQRAAEPGKASGGAIAAGVFTPEPEHPHRVTVAMDTAKLAGRFLTGRAYRNTAHVVDGKTVDLRAIEPPLPASDRILNANRLYRNAQSAFNLTGRFTSVTQDRLDQKVTAAHWTAPLPVRMPGVPNLYTLHDLIPLQFPYFVHGYGDRMFRMHETIVREADHIVTVSEASKQHIVDILKVPEERVTVTYQPVPPLPHVDRADAERLVETIYRVKPGQYALFLGAIEPKKNLKRLIEAYLLAGVGVPLLLAGPLGWMYDDILDLIEAVGSSNTASEMPSAYVRQLGYLPRRHVVALLQCAKFFVFPSIYEGFGLPVIEAMQLGVPVLTSNTSSLPEVAGDAALQIDPLDITALTDALRQIDADRGLREDLSLKGPAQAARFSTDDCRARLATAYKKVGITLTAPVRTPAPAPVAG